MERLCVFGLRETETPEMYANEEKNYSGSSKPTKNIQDCDCLGLTDNMFGLHVYHESLVKGSVPNDITVS